MEQESVTFVNTIFNLMLYGFIMSLFMDILVHNTKPIDSHYKDEHETKKGKKRMKLASLSEVLLKLNSILIDRFCNKNKRKTTVNKLKKSITNINTDVSSESESELYDESESESDHEVPVSSSDNKVNSESSLIRKSRRLRNLEPEYKGF